MSDSPANLLTDFFRSALVGYCGTSQVGHATRDAATNVYLYWLASHLDDEQVLRRREECVTTWVMENVAVERERW